MSDPKDAREQARVRRRWLTLGEGVAIAAVAISGLTFWNSWRERTAGEARQAADAAAASRHAATLVLRATPSRDGRTLALAPRSDTQVIQGQVIRFPAALGLQPVETSGDPRIERAWFEAALVKARHAAGAKDDAAGDARLPVLVTTSFLSDGDPHTDRAVFELGYRTTHAFLGGTGVALRGLSREGAAASDAAGQARIDAAWARRVAGAGR